LFSQQVLQPYPNVLAMACSGSLFLSSLIALGFLANAFQISCNCFIGIGKIISAMSRDGILPRWFGPEGINSVTHAPVRAYWTYLFLGIPVICLYAIIPPWNDYALSVVTVACGSVFFLTTFAATRLPTERFRKALAESDIGHVKPWVFQATGYIGALIAILMIGSYVVVPKLGLQGKTQVGSLVLGVIVVTSIVVVSRGSRGSDSKADEVSVSIQTD
jgi:amino acid transporter